jgi:hypothetical protein
MKKLKDLEVRNAELVSQLEQTTFELQLGNMKRSEEEGKAAATARVNRELEKLLKGQQARIEELERELDLERKAKDKQRIRLQELHRVESLERERLYREEVQ